MNKYLGFKEMRALAIVKPPKGASSWDADPMGVQGREWQACQYKVRMTIRGDQQIEGESFDLSDLDPLVDSGPIRRSARTREAS